MATACLVHERDALIVDESAAEDDISLGSSVVRSGMIDRLESQEG